MITWICGGLLAAGASVAAATGVAAAPEWVRQRPVVPGHWVGVGVARFEGDLPAARALATRNALNDVALQIRARVMSTARLQLSEGPTGLVQAYLGQVRVGTDVQLDGVEIAGTYEDARHCWALAQLSQEKFWRHRRQRVEAVRAQVLSLLATAAHAGPAAALAACLAALRVLEEPCADPLLAEGEDGLKGLAGQVWLGFREQLQGIVLETRPPKCSFRQGQWGADSLEVRVRTQDGRPAADLPLRCWFARGAGTVDPRSRTDARGVGYLLVRQVSGPQREQCIAVSLDLAGLADRRDRSGLPGLLAGLDPPAATITLAVAPARLRVQSRERNLGDSLSLLGPLLRRHLESQGQSLVGDAADADLVLLLDAATRPGQQLAGLYFSFLDLNIRVYDQRTGEEVFALALDQLKGAGADFRQAGLQAYTRAGHRIEAEVFTQLLAHLFE